MGQAASWAAELAARSEPAWDGPRTGGGEKGCWAASSMLRARRGGRKRGRDCAGSRGWAENEE